MPYKGKNNIEIRINQLMVAINHLVADIAKNLTAVNSEEATKQSFILPFFKELGYNVHNPREFKPEISSLNLPTQETMVSISQWPNSARSERSGRSSMDRLSGLGKARR